MTMAPTNAKAAEIIRRLSECVRLIAILLLSRGCNVNVPFRLVKGQIVLQCTRFNIAYQKVSAPKGFATPSPQ